MARFRGTIKGGRGEASRLGHASTGLSGVMASHQGAVKVTLRAMGELDHAEVWLEPHGQTGLGKRQLLYSGPVNGLEALKR